jgi:O-antigen ligase
VEPRVSAAKRRSTAKNAAREAASSGRPRGSGARTAKSAAAREGATGARTRAPLGDRLAKWSVWALAVVPPFLVSPTADDAFRLPKTLAAETLALLSLVALALGWWSRGTVSLAALARREATAFAALLATAVLPGAIVALHPQHWQRATISLSIALACLVLWSARLEQRTLRRALDLLVAPAAALALLAILQARGIFRPFAFTQGLGGRYRLTSLAGSVGDLAAFLVLPALVLQAALLRARTTAWRVVAVLALAVIVYAMIVSQTLAALAATVVASLLFWLLALPRKRWWMAVAPLLVAGVAILVVPQLGRRVSDKIDEIRAGRIDSLLSGRPDGWKASLEMFREHPWFGIGHGGYGSTFAPTKLELVERGVAFWSHGRSAHFANAHNDYLEALAEWGVWGALALAAALAFLARRLYRFERADSTDRALAIAGCAACAVLALASFPLRIALTAYPWLLLLAWIFTAPSAAPDERSQRVVVPARAWSAALCLLLVPVLVIHLRSLLQRLEASRIVHTTSQVAQQLVMQNGAAAARPVLQANLTPLRRAASLDPLAVGVQLTTASHYLLLGNAAAAIEGYQRGLAIEPRSELYLNQARALLMAGRREEAVASAAAAVTLDPQVAHAAADLGLREREPDRERSRGARGERRRRRAKGEDRSRGDSEQPLQRQQ